MKLVYEYLADALKFERLAAEEKDEQLKLSFLQQAVGREEGERHRQAFGVNRASRFPCWGSGR
jgi:hypothetical protein